MSQLFVERKSGTSFTQAGDKSDLMSLVVGTPRHHGALYGAGDADGVLAWLLIGRHEERRPRADG